MSETTSQAKKSSQQSSKQTDEEKFIEALLMRLNTVEEQNAMLVTALSKFATLSGHGNYLKEFGMDRWTPSKQDMTKY